MELLSNINKIAFFFFLADKIAPSLFSFVVHVGHQPSGTGVVVVLWRPDVRVGVHGEVYFLQVRRGLAMVWGDPAGLLLLLLLMLAGHFLVDCRRRLRSVVFPHPQLTGYKQSTFYRFSAFS